MFRAKDTGREEKPSLLFQALLPLCFCPGSDLSAGGHYSQSSQKYGVSSLPLFIANQASKLGIRLGWDLVTEEDLGDPLSKAAATGFHLNRAR